MATVHTVSGNVDGNHTMENAHAAQNGYQRRLGLNIPFLIKTPLGVLQIAATVINVLCIGIMGDAITVRFPNQTYWLIAGQSYMTFFVMLSFMCLVITTLIILTCLTSVNTSSKLPQTTFFMAYHAVSTIFYLCTSVAVLSEAAKVAYIYSGRPDGSHVDVRGQVLAAGSFGIFATVIYGALTVVAIYYYMKS